MKTKITTIIITGLLLIAVAIGHGRASYARGAEVASIEAEKAAKPLTTASLIKSLASLAEKAEGQGMTAEAQAIYAAIAVAAKGTPAK